MPENLDLKTFERLSRWVSPENEPPRGYYGKGNSIESPNDGLAIPDVVEAHLRADRNLTQDAAEMIASMVRTAYNFHLSHRPQNIGKQFQDDDSRRE